jgi:hypothetical protein
LAAFCHQRPRCVACSGEHESKDCKVDKATVKATCCNCGGPHPASYKGCSYYRSALETQQAVTQQRTLGPAANAPRTPGNQRRRLEENCLPKSPVIEGRTYAAAVSPKTPTPETETPTAQRPAAQASAPSPPADLAALLADILPAGFEWKTCLVSIASWVASLKLHPTVTAIAKMVPTLLAMIPPQHG